MVYPEYLTSVDSIIRASTLVRLGSTSIPIFVGSFCSCSISFAPLIVSLSFTLGLILAAKIISPRCLPVNFL
ncbi:hypothetical protein GLOIN_2v1704182, partial [Rhizophagus irregularis DAOM 181602=DAOM 197198]